MATSLKTLESLGKALALVPEVSFLPILGNYCVCSRGRAFAMVRDDQLFLKTSPETLCLFRDTTTRPFPGSVTMCKANDEWLEDPEKLGEVVLYTLASHPPPSQPGPARPAAREGRLVRVLWGTALAAGAVFTALYFLLPCRALGRLGIHKGAKAENFAVTGLGGEKIRLSDCGGKPALLYVWETFSQRAIDNLPMIDSLYAEYKDRQVCFLPVTITPDFNLDVRAFAATKALKYPVYNGAGRLPAQFLPEQSPMLYLIDHEGFVRDSYSPSINDLEEISSDLEALLRDVPAAPGP
ncbi:MAG: redoxin domain-containing protein [Elusimicrobiales bacterium]|nr:redoxin domain-containing protein [Elusimicrobiales bacterium]